MFREFATLKKETEEEKKTKVILMFQKENYLKLSGLVTVNISRRVVFFYSLIFFVLEYNLKKKSCLTGAFSSKNNKKI